MEPKLKIFIAKGTKWESDCKKGEFCGGRSGCDGTLCTSLLKRRNVTLSPTLLKPLKPPKKRALGALRLCNRRPQLNALLPSGSVYFLNINSGDRFKACLEIKHIIMWAELTRTIYCTRHLFWANRKRVAINILKPPAQFWLSLVWTWQWHDLAPWGTAVQSLEF